MGWARVWEAVAIAARALLRVVPDPADRAQGRQTWRTPSELGAPRRCPTTGKPASPLPSPKRDPLCCGPLACPVWCVPSLLCSAVLARKPGATLLPGKSPEALCRTCCIGSSHKQVEQVAATTAPMPMPPVRSEAVDKLSAGQCADVFPQCRPPASVGGGALTSTLQVGTSCQHEGCQDVRGEGIASEVP